MEKNARVEIGVTPSALSGQPSETIVDGEAVTIEETKQASTLKLPEVEQPRE